LPKDKGAQQEQIKVTDKRIFTPDGQIREEFRDDIKAVEPNFTKAAEPAAEPAPRGAAQQHPANDQRHTDQGPPPGGERRRTIADKGQNPGTAFTDFIEPLIAQAYMSLGMLKNPYSQKPAIDPNAARQMIEILTMLKDKTAGNLLPEEEDFLSAHLGELKLAFVQRTKTI
jgi:hypothetical protein